MVTVVKSEWHQVERRYALELDEDILSEIYPDAAPGELKRMLENIEDGTTDIDDVINDAFENGIDLDWDWLDEDDWWTERKGGYEVTYEVFEE